ncbi:MAG: hypothetical protein R6U98_32280, partial [Pirellulaceae bacterium]
AAVSSIKGGPGREVDRYADSAALGEPRFRIRVGSGVIGHAHSSSCRISLLSAARGRILLQTAKVLRRIQITLWGRKRCASSAGGFKLRETLHPSVAKKSDATAMPRA